MAVNFKWDIGVTTLSTYDADGFLSVQIDAFGEQDSGVHPYEAHHPYGFMGRHADPDTGPDAQPDGSNAGITLYAMEGGRGHAWQLGDTRVTPKLPPLSKGGSMQYSAAGSFSMLDGGNGSATIYVPNQDGKSAHVIQVDTSTPGQEAVTLEHSSGMLIQMTGGPTPSMTLKSADGGSRITIDNQGIHLVGNVTIQGGVVVGNPVTAVPVLVGLSGPAGVAVPFFKASPTP